MLILIPTLVFSISKPNSIFGQNLGRKNLSGLFRLKLGTQSVSRMLVLIPTLVSEIANLNLDDH